MEEQKLTIRFDREQLLYIASVILVAGIASNYSTVSPSETHSLVAKRVARYLMDTILR